MQIWYFSLQSIASSPLTVSIASISRDRLSVNLKTIKIDRTTTIDTAYVFQPQLHLDKPNEGLSIKQLVPVLSDKCIGD